MKTEGATRTRTANQPNEDAFLHFKIERMGENNQTIEVDVAVVADGIGGAPAGDEASHRAVEEIRRSLTQSGTELPIGRRLEKAVQDANEAIYTAALAQADKRGMGTTVVAAAVDENLLYVAHVGDSRAYLLRNGKAYCCTRDHLRPTRADGPNAESEEQRLSRRLGKHRQVNVDLSIYVHPSDGPIERIREGRGDAIVLTGGDKILLASDGLSSLSLEDIQNQAAKRGTPKETAERLIEQVQPGGDDVTVVVMERPVVTMQLLRWVGAVVLALVLLVVLVQIPLPPPSPPPETRTPTAEATTPSATPIPTEVAVDPGQGGEEPTLPPVPTSTYTHTPIPTPTSTQLPTTPPQLTPPTLNAMTTAALYATQTAVVLDARLTALAATAEAERTATVAARLTAQAQIPTSTPTPAETATNESTSPSDTSASLLPNDCTNIPNVASLQVILLSPPNDAAGSGPQTFTWDGPVLSEQGDGIICAYELFFYEEGQDPLTQGLGWAGIRFTPSASFRFDATLEPSPKPSTTYYWGVRLVVQADTHQPLELLSEGQKRTFRYEGPSGNNPCNGPGC